MVDKVTLAAITSELTTDPETIGYSGMTDQQAADAMNLANRTLQRVTLSASEIFEAVEISDYNALDANQKERVGIVLTLGDNIQVGPGSKARAWLLDAFPNGTTYNNLLNTVQYTGSRAEELGFPAVKLSWVEQARGG